MAESNVFAEQPATDDNQTGEVNEDAKRLQDKEEFIQILKQEKAEQYEELIRIKAERDLLANQRQTPQPPTPAPKEPDGTPPAGTPAKDIDLDELVARVKTTLTEDDKKRLRHDNTLKVADRLVEMFGDEAKANQHVRAKAAELGVSVAYMQDIAAQSPKAFYELTGLERETPKQAPAPRSEVNSAALRANPAGIKEGTYAWYQQMRREEPHKYFSPAMSQQRMKDAKRLGEAFYT